MFICFFYIFRAFGIAVVLKLLGTKLQFNGKKWNWTFIAGNIGADWSRILGLYCTETVLYRGLLHRD